MKAIFSQLFRDDLTREEGRYREISERLAGAFHERITGQSREIIRWRGGDHVGPHGFPCRRTKPFPFYICYQVQGDTIYFLGLVHESAPGFLKRVAGGHTKKEAGRLNIGTGLVTSTATRKKVGLAEFVPPNAVPSR